LIPQADNKSITVREYGIDPLDRRKAADRTLNYSFVAPLTPNLSSTDLGLSFRIGHGPGTWSAATNITLNRAQNSIRFGGVLLNVNGAMAATTPAKPGNGDRMLWGVWPFPKTVGPTINYLRPGKPSSYELMQAVDPRHVTVDYYPSPPETQFDQEGSVRAIIANLQREAILLEVDYLYGWVKDTEPLSPGWGWAQGRIPVAFGTQSEPRFQQMFAHEVAHSFGLGHNINATTNEYGWDVGVPDGRLKRGIGNLKGPHIAEIRAPGIPTNGTWIGVGSYTTAMNYIFTPRPIPTTISTLMVTVDDTSSGFDGRAVPLTRTGQPLVAGTTGSSELKVVDSQGTALYTTRFDAPIIESDLGAFAGDSVIELPYSASAHSVELRHNGNLQATITRSPNAPVVTVTSPTCGSLLGSTVTVAWSATDSDGDSLLTDVRYSKDGSVWKSMVFQEGSSSVTISTADLASSSNATIVVSVSDGFNRTDVSVCGLQLLANRSPEVVIETPTSNTHYIAGSNVILSAQTDDLEDRALPDTSITWHSNLSGSASLGQGAILELTNLAVGTHQIECRVTDSGGLTVSAFVTAIIDP